MSFIPFQYSSAVDSETVYLWLVDHSFDRATCYAVYSKIEILIIF